MIRSAGQVRFFEKAAVNTTISTRPAIMASTNGNIVSSPVDGTVSPEVSGSLVGSGLSVAGASVFTGSSVFSSVGSVVITVSSLPGSR